MRNPLALPPILVAALCLLLTACGADRPARPPAGKGPALWQVEKNGRRAYIFGTIHVLPDNVEWRTGKIDAALAGSDRLVLEATGLDDEDQAQAIFNRLGQRPGLPMLGDRLPAKERPALAAALVRGGLNEKTLSGYESWAAALLISSSFERGLAISSGEGVEPKLTALFREAGKPVEGFETVERQLGIFDALPEDVQRRFLAQTVDEAGEAGQRYQAMLNAWMAGDTVTMGQEFTREFSKDPALAAPILGGRNKSWAKAMPAMIAQPGTAFIAVGAGHLVGGDSLIALLAGKGYKVTRLE